MAFVVSSLTNYTNEQSTELLGKALFGGKTAAMLYNAGQVQVGVKSAEALNILSSDVYFQTDACSLTPSGNTTFSQRVITVGKIAVAETLCPKTLEAKWMQTQIAPGSATALPFEDQIGAEKARVIAENLEIALWQGDTASTNTNPNTNKFDGLTKLLDNAGFGGAGAVSGNTTGATAITSSNIDDLITAIYQAVPARISEKNNLTLFVGIDTYKTMLVKLKALNLFHYNPDAGTDMQMVYPGTNVTVIGVGGLSGTNKMICTHLTNIYLGTDLAHEEEQFKFVFDPLTENVWFKATCKYGVQFAFPNEVVYFKL